jgi:hypothetical protein
MTRVSDSNYVHLLQESITVLGQIQAHLSQNKSENSLEIANISQAIGSLQNVIRSERQKVINSRNRGYKQRFEEQKAKKQLEQLRQINEQKGSQV